MRSSTTRTRSTKTSTHAAHPRDRRPRRRHQHALQRGRDRRVGCGPGRRALPQRQPVAVARPLAGRGHRHAGKVSPRVRPTRCSSSQAVDIAAGNVGTSSKKGEFYAVDRRRPRLRGRARRVRQGNNGWFTGTPTAALIGDADPNTVQISVDGGPAVPFAAVRRAPRRRRHLRRRRDATATRRSTLTAAGRLHAARRSHDAGDPAVVRRRRRRHDHGDVYRSERTGEQRCRGVRPRPPSRSIPRRRESSRSP